MSFFALTHTDIYWHNMLNLKLMLINYSWTYPRGKKNHPQFLFPSSSCFSSSLDPCPILINSLLVPVIRYIFSLVLLKCRLVCSVINWNDFRFYLWLWCCVSLKVPREKLFRSVCVWSESTGFTYFSFAYVRLLLKTIWSGVLIWRSEGQAPAPSSCHCRAHQQDP